MRIGDRVVDVRRNPLKVHEAAVVLQRSEREIRNMIRRGALSLRRAGRLRRVDATELAWLVDDRPLALEVLADLVEGRLRAPRAATPESAAPSLAQALAWGRGPSGRSHLESAPRRDS